MLNPRIAPKDQIESKNLFQIIYLQLDLFICFLLLNSYTGFHQMTSKLDVKLWNQSGWTHYLTAIVLAIVGLYFRTFLTRYLGSAVPFGLSILPVLVSAYIGGFGPGLVSAVIGLSSSFVLFVHFGRTPAGFTQTDLLSLLTSSIICIFICVICGRLRESALRNQKLVEKIERDAQQVSDVLNTLPDPFYSVDRDWFVIQANPAFEGILEERASIVGKNLWREFPGREGTPIYNAFMASMNQRVAQELEVEYPAAQKWYRVQVFPTEFGISVFNQDITERKQFDQIRERTLIEERIARSSAEESGRLKDEFLAILSHELRTPMTSLLGWAELLTGEAKTSENLAMGLSRIEQSARKQLKMIEDLLDLGSINSGKMRIEVEFINLADIVEEAIYFHQPAAEAKSIKLSFFNDASTLIIKGDSARLHQVISNLTSNAIKFTPRLGTVEIRAYVEESSACIDVLDNGEGIAAEYIPVIFDRFRQVNSSASRMHGGLGLGLSIANQLVQLHGGPLTASSEGLGKGSKFTVKLPLAKKLPSIVDRSPNELEASQLEGLKILVIEDDPDTRELLQVLLEKQSATVETAASGREALQHLDIFGPDVIISDIGLPGMDGYALIRVIRGRTDELSKVKAVALTAFARESDRKAALDAGFDAYQSKPINMSTLLQTIAAIGPRQAV